MDSSTTDVATALSVGDFPLELESAKKVHIRAKPAHSFSRALFAMAHSFTDALIHVRMHALTTRTRTCIGGLTLVVTPTISMHTPYNEHKLEGNS